MTNLKIYLDKDGVIVDLVRHTYRMRLAEDRIEAAFAATTEWDSMGDVLTHELVSFGDDPYTMDDVQAMWADGGAAMWEALPWTSYGRDLYTVCCAAAPVVLMTTPTRDPSSAAGKMAWIQKNIPFGRQRDYSLSPCKAMMAHPNALLVDDGEHNIEAFAKAGGETFLWPAPWNAAGKGGISMQMAFDLLAIKIDELKRRG